MGVSYEGVLSFYEKTSMIIIAKPGGGNLNLDEDFDNSPAGKASAGLVSRLSPLASSETRNDSSS
jgi:hypothetical protein